MMKKKYFGVLFMTAVVLWGIMGCGKNSGEEVQEENGQDYFNAKVLEVYDSFLAVECLDVTTGTIMTGTEVHVSKKVSSTNAVPDLQVGDEIRVVFTGVQEIYPLQLQTVWAIYLLDEAGNVIVTENISADSERDTESSVENNIEFSIIEVSSEKSSTSDEQNWGITLSVKDVTASGVTLVCMHSGGVPTGDLQTGSEYKLLVLENGAWELVPTVIEEYAWDAVAYLLPMNGSREFEINWKWLYGELPAGTYRISKEIMDFRGSGDYDTAEYWVEFEIN